MNRRFQIPTLLVFLVLPIVAGAQAGGPQLIDEFRKLDSETAVVRLQTAMSRLADHAVDHPGSLLEFVIFRGNDQSIGEPYHTFGTQKAFYAAEHYDTNRIVSTICDVRPTPYVQIWIIDSLAQKHTCADNETPLSTTTLFISLTAPNEKYEMGSCCMIDEVRYPASIETVGFFAQFVKDRPETAAYIVVYGGTNVLWHQVDNGPKKSERHIDPASFIRKLSNDVRRRLLSSGLGRSRFTLINGGYRDQYASIDLWIVPAGSKVPEPTPNYFPHRRPKKSSRHKAH